MSKSEQKRICVQSECAVRDELRNQLDIKGERIKELEKELQKYKDAVDASVNLYDNRLGWSDGRNPYVHPEFWDTLKEALNQLEGGSE